MIRAVASKILAMAPETWSYWSSSVHHMNHKLNESFGSSNTASSGLSLVLVPAFLEHMICHFHRQITWKRTVAVEIGGLNCIHGDTVTGKINFLCHSQNFEHYNLYVYRLTISLSPSLSVCLSRPHRNHPDPVKKV